MIGNLLFILLLLFSFFPYVTLGGLSGIDSQPNALIVSLVLFFFYSRSKIDIRLFLLLLVLIVSMLIYIYSFPFTFNSTRSLINYVSLFFVTYVTFEGLKRTNGLSFNIYKYSVYCWFIVGCVQLFLWSNFLSFLLPRGNSESTLMTGRGIVCLAPEPTFYGLMCFMFMIIGYINFSDRKSIKYIFMILLIQLIFFSRSSLCIISLLFVCILYLFVSFFYMNYKLKIIFLLSGCFVFSISFYVLLNFLNDLHDYRVGNLLTYLFNNPLEFLFMDASVNERFNHLFFSIYGSVSNYFVPYGYDSFNDYIKLMHHNSSFNIFFSEYLYGREYIRILSGVGGLLFELGFVGLFPLYIICNCFFRMIIYDRKILFFFLLFLIVIFAGMPLVTSIVPFTIGNILYLSLKRK